MSLVASLFRWAGESMLAGRWSGVKRWMELGEALGVSPQRYGKSWLIEGEWRSFGVQVQGSSEGPWPLNISVHLAGEAPHLFFLHQAESDLRVPVGGVVIKTGDPSFDRRVAGYGGWRLFARLSGTLRARVMEFVARGGRINGRMAHIERMGRGLAPVGVLAQMDEMVSILEGLYRQPEFSEAASLAEMIRNDLEPAVRWRALHALRELPAECGAAELAVNISRELAHCQDPDMRLTAAVCFGDEGLGTLAVLMKNPRLSSPCLASALGGFAKSASPARVVPYLKVLVDSQDMEVATTCVEWLFRFPELSGLGFLGTLIQGDRKWFVRWRAFVAMKERWDPSFEPPLWDNLGVKRDAGNQLHAVEILRQFGSVASVEPLLNVANAPFRPPMVRRAARQAIARIQSRLGNIERGTVSLAEMGGPEGAVSFAPEGGEVSDASQAAGPYGQGG